MQDTELAGFEVFRPTWRSVISLVALLPFLFGIWLAWKALTLPASASLLLWSIAALMLWCAWLLTGQIRGAAPALAVGPQGVFSRSFKGQVVPWRDIADIQHQQVQGNDILVLHLRAGAPSVDATRSWKARGLERNIPLAVLRKAQRPEAVKALMQAWVRYAPDNALAAIEQQTAQLAAIATFESALRERVPHVWALWSVIAINVAVWLLNLRAGMDALSPSADGLFAWGANSTAAVVQDHEYWRLLTATFLHGGALHLGLNMVALWDAGRQVCRWFGNGQFLLVYLASALVGSALSLHFGSLQVVSVGASGAVFGIFGALMVGMYQHRGHLPPKFAQQRLTSQVMLIVFMLAQGFGRTGIDNAAHVGGLVAGCILAWLLVELVDTSATAARRRAGQVAAVAAAALLVGALTGSAPGDGVNHRQRLAEAALMQRMQPRIEAVQRAFQADVDAVKKGTLSEAQLLVAMEQRHIAAYQEVARALAPAGVEPASAAVADLQRIAADTADLMRVEVDKARGRLDAATADRRQAELGESIRAASKRLQALRAAQPASNRK